MKTKMVSVAILAMACAVRAQGADPSAVVFDALQAAKARKVDYGIVDTAGRLHTKTNLMAELEKMRRTAQRLVPGAPHETLLVMDATTGQNGLQQARLFTQSAGVTGIVRRRCVATVRARPATRSTVPHGSLATLNVAVALG